MGFAAPGMAEPQTEPRNVIIMIGDGMGFNHVDASSLYNNGKTNWQIEGKPGAGDKITKQDGYGETPSQVYENFDVQLSMKHPSLDSPEYKSEDAWGDFDWANNKPTDSAASGTALATGQKTHNGYLGVDGDKNPIKNAAEHAHETGRATGVVSSVPFGHATPAAWGAHVESRKENHKIAQQMIDGSLDVIMGAGHPKFDDDAQPREAEWAWLTEEQYAGLQKDGSGRTFVEDTKGIEAIARGENVPERLFGLAPVAETLQFNRSSLEEAEPRNKGKGRTDGQPIEGEAPKPGEAKKNDVVSLENMTKAALNVLSQDEDGFFTMIEGGAIDWAGHANATVGNIEEMDDFNKSVEAVTEWVEKNSSWEETLVIVTADHETGYLNGAVNGTADEGAAGEGNAAPAAAAPAPAEEGAASTKQWAPMTGTKGTLPIDSWNSPQHTNHLVPFFAKGAGADTINGHVKGTDPVRGDYIDNTDVAKISFDLMKETSDDPTDKPGEKPEDGDADQPAEEPGKEEQPGDDEQGREQTENDEESADSDDDPSEAPAAAGSGSNTGGALPRTGTEIGAAAAIAAGLLAAGTAAVVAGRRKRATTDA
ncbi:alkaline phosphatase [Brevibacterium ravenspurgense]|uniref:alkaline phosphatase n=1 Tax=Brevibacterium ravenspurgense TaxID=479117 RepID=UPI001EF20714|nr:alkaline phosphatase [Brevibacterium ravenspurgense]MCG7300130.1 alkaline phosphatase [Brevibacterium ravenspurgense]